MLDSEDAMNGGADPFPIPWLDKNGSHNQSPGPRARAVEHFSPQWSDRSLQRLYGHGNRWSRAAGLVRYEEHERSLPLDQPKWPAHDATTTPAVMSYRVMWTAGDEPAEVTNDGKQFRFTGRKASAKLEAEVEIPSTGFRWKSDAMETSAAAFAVIGQEMNGRYFSS